MPIYQSSYSKTKSLSWLYQKHAISCKMYTVYDQKTYKICEWRSYLYIFLKTASLIAINLIYLFDGDLFPENTTTNKKF